MNHVMATDRTTGATRIVFTHRDREPCRWVCRSMWDCVDSTEDYWCDWAAWPGV